MRGQRKSTGESFEKLSIEDKAKYGMERGEMLEHNNSEAAT